MVILSMKNRDGNTDTTPLSGSMVTGNVQLLTPPERPTIQTPHGRPRYENRESLSNEDFVATVLQAKKGNEGRVWHKLAVSYNVDYWTDDRVIEVKCRKVVYGHYPDFYMALRKWRDGLSLAAAMGANGRFIIVAGYTDGIYLTVVDPRRPPCFTVDWNGRQDRGDGADMEPVVHLAHKEFIRQSKETPWKEVSNGSS